MTLCDQSAGHRTPEEELVQAGLDRDWHDGLVGDSAPIYDDKSAVRTELDLTEAEWRRYDAGRRHDRHVEIAFVEHTDGVVYTVMRSSADQTGPMLVFTPAEWDAFTRGVLAGEFDQAERSALDPGTD